MNMRAALGVAFVAAAARACDIRLVESIPEGVEYNSPVESMSTYSAWRRVLDAAESRLELASSYWSLRGIDVDFPDPSAYEGEDIFTRLLARANDGLDIRVAQSEPTADQPPYDTDLLKLHPSVTVKNVNMASLVGAGILHTKLWLADRKHFYLGSANFDWRSLTQVQEMGVLAMNCPDLAHDMGKIFEAYWTVGGEGSKIPTPWPASFDTEINPDNRLKVENVHNGKNETLSVYLSSSPPQLCAKGRITDVDALVKVIDAAEKFVYIAVMDYLPITIYTSKPQFIPQVDDAIRRAAIERGVEVRMLLSNWTHTDPTMITYFRSLLALGEGAAALPVHGKLFKVKSTKHQDRIPFARVNHNKYVVTEKEGLIMTSNWTPDYFRSTGGVSFGFSSDGPADREMNTRLELEKVFMRNWQSKYAHKVNQQ